MANTILRHSSRFRELEISEDVPDPAFDDHLRCALEKPMHYLHSLTIARHVEESNQTFIMPDAPSLHCIHLINTPTSFNTFNLSTITELELSCDNASEGFTYELLCLLRDMQSLKSLITNSETTPLQLPTASIPFTEDVRLPYLKTMRLSGTLYHCAYIALSVEIPTSCFCSIICTGLNRRQRSNLPLMSAAIINVLSGCRAPEALIISISRYRFEISVVEDDTTLAEHVMEFEFGWNSDFRDDAKAYFTSPFGNQFLRSVKHLQLGIGITKNIQLDTSLHALIFPCINMQTLELIGGDSVGILFSFIQSHGDRASKLLPALQALVITGLKSYHFKPKEVDSRILSFIKWRSDIGLPFKSIRFSGNRFRMQPLVDQLAQIEGLEVKL
ncbi:hypothetical protein BDQ12DRAFT_736231 [Crucibulum laeve]|uniref:Uncharacterized protein n=1 Tax=Crucibulum laeve TaxID=68775 RepID=A0A5C3LW15_9AGAR|nr:hypothetical protein BDQ12DRAFT_736231 [Crucibulum laeve]